MMMTLENQINTQALPNPWASSSTNSRQTSPTSAAGQPAANPFSALYGSSAFSNQNVGDNRTSWISNVKNDLIHLFGFRIQAQATPITHPIYQATHRLWWILISCNSVCVCSKWCNSNNRMALGTLNHRFLSSTLLGMYPTSCTSTHCPSYSLTICSSMNPVTTTSAQTSSEPPEQRFASQITQLEEMGFSERDRNVRALLATGGDVQAAIEYLLSQ